MKTISIKQNEKKIIIETSEDIFIKNHIEITDEILQSPEKKAELIKFIEKMDF